MGFSLKLNRVIMLFGMFFTMPNILISQSFSINGTTQKILNSDCYKLTSAVNGQNGSVWFSDKLDLTKPFDLEFTLNFGTNDGGADGIVFVIQTVGTTALGQSGGSLGFEGFSPAMGIEFDDFQNTNMNDPVYDHIALIKNGSVLHPTGASIYKPVSALTNNGNIEDGKDHLVRIKWNPSGFKLDVFFDCVSRLSISNLDISTTILNNKSDVWWGFTASTGGLNNNQTVCIENSVFRMKTWQKCVNTGITLTTGNSFNNTYNWVPSTFLSNPGIKTPFCTADKDITYIVTFKDRCNNDVKDTIAIKTRLAPLTSLPKDTTLCSFDSLLVKPSLTNSYSSWQWSNSSKSINQYIKPYGWYWFEVLNSCGKSRDSIFIKQAKKPELFLGNDSAICMDDTLQINPITDGNITTFKWVDNFPSVKRKTTLGGYYIANIQNVCGITSDSILLTILKKPIVNLGSDTVLCPEDTIQIKPILSGTYNSIIWNDLSDTPNKTIVSSQKLWLTAQGKCGSATDTIQITYLNPKPLFLGNDTGICNKDTLLIKISSSDFSNLTWADGYQGYTRYITKAGNYRVEALNRSCRVSDDISVVIDYSPYFNKINDTSSCINVPLVYQIDSGNTKVRWDDGETYFLKKYLNSPGKHWVEVSAKCGQKADSFNVLLIECLCNFWIPNAITPGNGDGLNDLFEVKYDCKYQSFHLQIFNRWGEKLWETYNPDEYWDGTYNGKPVSLGAYFWIASYLGPNNGVVTNYIQKGTLTILK